MCRAGNKIWGTLSGPNMESRSRWAKVFAKSKKETINAVRYCQQVRWRRFFVVPEPVSLFCLCKVQSLRNGLMVAVANTSTALALLSVCLGPLLEAYTRGSFPLLRELLPFPNIVFLNVAKFSVLLGLLVVQFVSFSQVCYFWVHLTFMLPIADANENTLVSTEGLVDIATHAQSFWWWGYRSAPLAELRRVTLACKGLHPPPLGWS